jgi:hypothetical protein
MSMGCLRSIGPIDTERLLLGYLSKICLDIEGASESREESLPCAFFVLCARSL